MNNVEIETILNADVIARRFFRGVFPKDKLPINVNHSQPGAFVINTDSSDGAGKHWVCLYLNGKGKAEYMDSFGFSPSVYPDIQRFVYDNSYSCKHNPRILQGITSSACGLYVIYFVLMKSRGRSFSKLLSIFNPFEFRLNDKKVARAVTRLARKKLIEGR